MTAFFWFFHFILWHYIVNFAKNQQLMPRKLTPTAGQKRTFLLHFIVFAIATVVMVMIHKKQGEHHWAYPWHAWIIAAWALSLIGHWCAVYTNYEDKGLEDYRKQESNG